MKRQTYLRTNRTKEDLQYVEDMSLDEVKYQLTVTKSNISKNTSELIKRYKQIERLQPQLKEKIKKKAKILKIVNELEQQIKILKSNKPYRAQDFPSLVSYLEDMEQENTEDDSQENTLDLENPETNNNYETELKLFIKEALLYKRKFGIETRSSLLDGYLDMIPPYKDTLNRENPADNNPLKPTWKILEQAGTKQTRVLLDGLGHGLTNSLSVFRNPYIWNCNKYCKARVKQIDDDFIQVKDHICKPIPDLEAKLKCELLIKTIGNDKKFVDSKKIATDIIQEFSNRGYTNLPNARIIQHRINVFRRANLPPNPEDLWFDIDMDFIPDKFLQGEVVVRYRKETKRHLIFATEQQMSLLGIAEQWYLDLTYKLISDPFVQILVISVWIPYRFIFKHIPLAFVLMSRTTTKDFKCVFEKLLEIFKNEVNVEEFVCDYQTSLWKAVKSSFPYATVTGCGFHWFQDVIRAVKKCGLADLFMNDEEVRKVCTRLLCLYLLPSEKIPKIFSILKKKAAKLDLSVESARQLSELFFYIETTWINNPTWPIHIWSSFGEPIRKGYIAGNHRKFRFSKKLSFYALVDMLFSICERNIAHAINDEQQLCVPFCRESLIENFLRTGSHTYVSHIFNYCVGYEKGNFNALKLLKLCAEETGKNAIPFFSHVTRIYITPEIDYDKQKVIETTSECPCS